MVTKLCGFSPVYLVSLTACKLAINGLFCYLIHLSLLAASVFRVHLCQCQLKMIGASTCFGRLGGVFIKSRKINCNVCQEEQGPFVAELCEFYFVVV